MLMYEREREKNQAVEGMTDYEILRFICALAGNNPNLINNKAHVSISCTQTISRMNQTCLVSDFNGMPGDVTALKPKNLNLLFTFPSFGVPSYSCSNRNGNGMALIENRAKT